MHKKKIILIIFLLSGLISCRSAWLYFPEKNYITTPDKHKMLYEQVSIKTSDNETVTGWYVEAVKNKGTVLFFHGNGGNISHRIHTAMMINRMGYNLFIIDYRGYGKSSGSPSEDGTFLDASAAWDYLIKQKNKIPENIIVWGRSLGGSVAAWTAKEKKSAILICESSFMNLSEIVNNHQSCIPGFILAGNDYNTIEYVKSAKCPLLVIHSKQDEVVPFYHGQEIFKASKNKKKFILIHGRHNTGYFESSDIYIPEIEKFLNENYSSTEKI